jgi:hypothetical protein
MIVTTHSPKPIPDRRFDWEAASYNYDIGDPIGFGATESEAIADLLESCDHEHERPDDAVVKVCIHCGHERDIDGGDYPDHDAID